MDYNIDDMKDLITDRFSFRDLRERDLLYVDKTEYIFRLVSSPSRFFFLSRPRRFGKSLFCSTLHELFEGRSELFQGLYIAEDTDYGFERHPVIHLDFSELQTTSRDDFLIAFQELISGGGSAQWRHNQHRCSCPDEEADKQAQGKSGEGYGHHNR